MYRRRMCKHATTAMLFPLPRAALAFWLLIIFLFSSHITGVFLYIVVIITVIVCKYLILAICTDRIVMSCFHAVSAEGCGKTRQVKRSRLQRTRFGPEAEELHLEHGHLYIKHPEHRRLYRNTAARDSDNVAKPTSPR